MRLLAIATLLSVISTSVFAAPPMMGTSTDPNAVAFKNGSTEVLTINSNGTVSGQTPTANAHLATKQYVDTQIASNSGGGSKGYFVLSNGTWNGNLGGLAGANAKCLADLTANNWYGKADATLNSTTVKAWLCDSTTCQNLQAYTRYQFAQSGDITKGGAYIDTIKDGVGPDNLKPWSGDTRMQGFYVYSNRGRDSDYVWENTPYTTGTSGSCQNFTDSSSGPKSQVGKISDPTYRRWSYDWLTCNNAINLICMVHPQ